MGGKGGKAPAPPPVTQAPEADYGPMLAMMQQMMSVMGQQQPIPPQIPLPPAISAAEPIDFSTKTAELAERMKATFNTEQSRQRGRSATVLTSSLLDEEVPGTTNASLLSSGIT